MTTSKMNTKTLLGFMIAAVIALFAVSAVYATETGTLPITISSVEVNDVALGSGTTLAGMAGETVPVVVKFTATQDLQDVKLKVWIDGYKSDVSASTSRFDVINGSTYVKRLTLTLPTTTDMESVSEGLTLYVSASDKTDEKQDSYNIEMQRDSYALNVLSVDAPTTATSGEIIALDVVLKNIGSRDAEDTFVTAAIPELGISKKAYFGDLYPKDNANNDNNNEDAVERRLYLVIPADAKSGDYTLQVSASDYDTNAFVKKVISINGMTVNNSTNAITPTSSGSKIPTSVLVLTVALVIIFLVLLVVLIVLLTKKPSEKVEDYGETSYY